MFDYIEGKVDNIGVNYIVIDVGNIGYKIFVNCPYTYKENDIYKIYIYNSVKEDENILYGFNTSDERAMFLKLISVKGLGAKTAMPILAAGNINSLIDAIEKENILYLKKFPKVGDKLGRQIILDLKGKLVLNEEVSKNEELVNALLSLGYKYNDFKGVISKIDTSNIKIEVQVKEALKMLLR
ncbi:MAG: Holliday junction branch migration protein RuvA [Bacilli bacterium]